MPTYQYACTDAECANRFEVVQSFTDPAASECPVCHHAVRKVYGSVGVVFKGSGFYRNDSRAAASAASNRSGSDSSNSDSKSESKAAAKADSKSESKADSRTDSTPKSGSKSDAKPAAKSAPAVPAASG